MIPAEEIAETLVEDTEAIIVAKATELAINLPEVKLPSETFHYQTTSALKRTKADTRKLIGAFRSASSVAPKRPSPIVTSSSLFIPPLLLSAAPTLQR